MRYINLTIKGITPLMTFPFTDADLAAVSSGIKQTSTTKQKDSIQERAAKKVYYTRDNKPCIPKALLDATLRGAAVLLKIASPYACIDVEDAEAVIQSEHPFEVDVRSAVNPHTKGRMEVVRPIWYDWTLDFSVGYEETLISESILRDVVDAAGIRQGIGSYRPAAKGSYGKFKVIGWESRTL